MQPELGAWRDRGVDVFVIAMGNEADLRSFFQQRSFAATVIHDANANISRAYGVPFVPFNIWLDKQGRIAHVHAGWTANSYEMEMLPAMEKLLSEKK